MSLIIDGESLDPIHEPTQDLPPLICGACKAEFNSTNAYEDIALHMAKEHPQNVEVAPTQDEFNELQAKKKQQLRSAAEQALELVKPILDTQTPSIDEQIDEIVENYDVAFFTDIGKKSFKQALKALLIEQRIDELEDLLQVKNALAEYGAWVRTVIIARLAALKESKK